MPKKQAQGGLDAGRAKRSKTNTSEGPSGAPSSDKMVAFEAWLREIGFGWDHKDLELRGSGTISAAGVFAKRKIKEGKVAVTIPKTGCITWRTSALQRVLLLPPSESQSEQPAVPAAAATLHAPRNVKLTLCLLYERYLGPASAFAPYIDTLPSHEPGVPLLWSDAEVRGLLGGTELAAHVTWKQEHTARAWQRHVKPLVDAMPELFPASHFGLDCFLRASTLVSSRSFAVDRKHGPGMVPFADLFNHLTGAEHLHFTGGDVTCCNCGLRCGKSDGGAGAEREDDEDDDEEEGREEEEASGGAREKEIAAGEEDGDAGVCSVDKDEKTDEKREEEGEEEEEEGEEEEEEEEDDDGVVKEDELFMEVVREVDKGTEVFNTYGPLASAALLSRYGFVDEDNENDFVTVSEADAVAAAGRFWGAEAEKADVAARWKLCVHAGILSGPSPESKEYFVEFTRDQAPHLGALAAIAVLALDHRSFQWLTEAFASVDELDLGSLLEGGGHVVPESLVKFTALLLRVLDRHGQSEEGGGDKSKAMAGDKNGFFSQPIGQVAEEAVKEMLSKCELAEEDVSEYGSEHMQGSDVEIEGEEGEEGEEGDALLESKRSGNGKRGAAKKAESKVQNEEGERKADGEDQKGEEAEGVDEDDEDGEEERVVEVSLEDLIPLSENEVPWLLVTEGVLSLTTMLVEEREKKTWKKSREASSDCLKTKLAEQLRVNEKQVLAIVKRWVAETTEARAENIDSIS